MKKIIVLLLVSAMLLTVPVSVRAASASLAGPDVIRAGDTITLTFYAGGGILGCRGVLSYDSSVLQLQGITPSIGGAWKVDISGNIIMAYDDTQENPINGTSAICTITFRVLDVAPGTTASVSISAELTTTALTAAGGGGSWSKTVSEPLSGNADLATLTVANAAISPAFDPNTTEYTASVPFETTNLQVAATAQHPGAKVAVGNTWLAENGTTDVTVTVTAENGTKKVYHIRTWRPRDPNYVESTVNTLDSLGVEGFLISPGFTTERLAYAVYLPYEVESIKLTAKTTDPKAGVALPTVSNIPVGQATYEVKVTAENGAVLVYTVTTFRAEPFPDPNAVPEETEPVTEPTTEPTVEPTTEPTTEPTVAPTETEPAPTQPAVSQQGNSNGLLWILSVVLALGVGIAIPLIFKKREIE